MTTKTAEPTFTAESIRARIADLEQERDSFVQQANQQIAMLNGAIRGLEGLLSENGQEEIIEKQDAQ